LTITDKSAQERAEAALQESEALLCLVIDNLPVLIAYVDKDQRFRLVNKACSEWYGLPKAEIVGKRVAEIHGDRYALFAPRIAKVLAGESHTFEDEVLYNDGRVRVIRSIHVPDFDADGAVRGYFSLTEDISDRKHAEQRVTQLMTAIDQMGEIVVLFDADDRLVFYNAKFREANKEIGDLIVPGMTFEELIRARLEKGLTPEAVGREEAWFARRMAHHHNPKGLMEQGMKGGGRYLIREHRLEDGSTIAINTDITQQRQLEDRLRHADKMQAIGHLAGGIAHEFNNMMQAIQSNVELLAEVPGTDPDIVQSLEAMRLTAKRGGELTGRLLSFSRLQTLRPQPTEIRSLVNDVVRLLSRTLGETIDIDADIPDGLWPVMVDQTELTNAIVNLAINARDAMPNGGRITLSANNLELSAEDLPTGDDLAPGAYVRLIVDDNGAGMPPKVREQAFAPFFTTKEVGKGTGLGLSMVYGFTKQSGGHVEIESEEGRGTAVTLYLPKAHTAEAMIEANETRSIPRGNGETILVIEDDSVVRSATVRMLKRLGYTAVDTADAAAARKILDEGRTFDLILSDIVLPGGVSGPELAREVRAIHPDMKTIFVSGYPTDTRSDDDYSVSHEVFLKKPFKMDELASALCEALYSKLAE
jgi:PAS domain S-box-containing protein